MSRDGRTIGVIVTAVTWDALADYVGTMDQTTTPFVLVGLDRVIVHPNIGQVMTPTGALPKLGDVGDEHLARIWTDQRRPAFGTQGPRSQTHWELDRLGLVAGAQYSYRTIDGYGADHWIVGFHQDSRATMRERWIVQSLLYGSGLLLLVGTLAAWGWRAGRCSRRPRLPRRRARWSGSISMPWPVLPSSAAGSGRCATRQARDPRGPCAEAVPDLCAAHAGGPADGDGQRLRCRLRPRG